MPVVASHAAFLNSRILQFPFPPQIHVPLPELIDADAPAGGQPVRPGRIQIRARRRILAYPSKPTMVYLYTARVFFGPVGV
jgi:hypothetical protein